MKKPLRHIVDYFLLCAIFSSALLSLIFFNGNPQIQIIIVVLTSFTYILWGYFHHKKEGEVNPKTIIEYIVYGILGGVLILGLL